MNGFKSFFKWLFLSLVVLVAILGTGFFLVSPAHAAPASPALVASVHQTGDPEIDARIADFLNLLVNAVTGLVVLPFAAPLTVLIANLLKRYLPTSISGGVIHLAISVVIWVAYVIVTRLGYGVQFQTGVNTLFQILSILLPLFGIQVAGQALYNYSAKRDIAAFGYQRPVAALPFGERRG